MPKENGHLTEKPTAAPVVSLIGAAFCILTILICESIIANSSHGTGGMSGLAEAANFLFILVIGGAGALVSITVCVIGGCLTLAIKKHSRLSIAGGIASVMGPLIVIGWVTLRFRGLT